VIDKVLNGFGRGWAFFFFFWAIPFFGGYFYGYTLKAMVGAKTGA